MNTCFKLALCQMRVLEEKSENIKKALGMIGTAADNGADMVVLPEMFNCPYDNRRFNEYAEPEDGKTIKSISAKAKELGIYVVAGSIPESDEGKIYNTSFVIDRNGVVAGKHRKMHLFDINVPGKITFKESLVLSPGNDITVVDTEYGKVGVAICYDMRFPELFRLMALKGAKLVIVPGAFNMVTGHAHWEPLIRIRAVDNQVFIAAVSPARDESAGYVAYGNSMVAEPWGRVIARAEEAEAIVYADIDVSEVDRVRSELPLLKGRRTDIYELADIG